MKTNLFVTLILLPIILSSYSCTNKERQMIKEGNEIINKIEKFRKDENKLPDNFQQIGISEKEEGPFYYKKIDSNSYMIWFGRSLGESKTYYSDSKTWEDHLN